MAEAALRWRRRTNLNGDVVGGLVALTATHRFEIHRVYPHGWHLDIYDGATAARAVARITADLLSTARSEAAPLAGDPGALARLIATAPQPPDLNVDCLTQEVSTLCPYALDVGHRTCLSGCWTEPCGDHEPATNGLGAPVTDPDLDAHLRETAARISNDAHARRGW